VRREEAFMERWLKNAGVALLGILIALQAGCTRPGTIISSPSWHQLKSGYYNTSEGRFFYGVGHAEGVQNLMLLRATADNRARKELGRVLDKYVLELARSVPDKLDPNWATLAVGERRQILGIVVRNAMQDAVIIDHWSASRESKMLALCRLNLSDFKMVLSNSGALDARMRAAMVSEADKVHARLADRL
jgi:hypothetical protein